MNVVRYSDLHRAIDPDRKLVKLAERVLWKPAWPGGAVDWQVGHEVESETIGVSLFTTGACEDLHSHERVWELYQVIEGLLVIAVSDDDGVSWHIIELRQHDLLLLPPGELHLVDSTSQHVTLVVQVPPASSDKQVVRDPGVSDAVLRLLSVHNGARDEPK